MSPTFLLDEPNLEQPFAELLQALRTGDGTAWTGVFDRLLPRVTAAIRLQFGAAVSRSGNAGSEAVASACRTIYRNIKAGNFVLEDWHDLTGLFIRIALNKCIDKLGEQHREMPLTDLQPAQASGECNLLDQPAPDRSPLDEILRREAIQEFKRIVDLVRRRLARKNPKCRAIFNLRLEGMYTNKQIAEQVGCTERAVTRVWQDAVELLRCLQNGSLDEGETP